ncbi:hypothetical protein Val02_93490 [Virgisporangium aliadipatigenens]|uniref:DUF2637 domain-containing protein n=1 Tax=Virgisporangium aliadipatigenens TaxID=741659 RepID=A0A8J3YZK7_9ACTN|nr:hypothetical protein [Virgisporangium aliadipatigenens]GIJ52463.1 hypothetical protein Val02_93490 [Virgisporangium aliadipatigenens]
MSVYMSGRAWAYVGAVLGGAVSIAANVAHSFVTPQGAPADWSPDSGAVVGAVVWPVFLFVAVEILARVSWPNGVSWRIVRWGGLLPVALVAALVSYRHLSGLLAHYGEEPLVVVLGPLAVDGLMIMATAALMATSRSATPALMPIPQQNHAASTTIPVPTTPIPTTVNPVAPSTVDTQAAPSFMDDAPARSAMDDRPERPANEPAPAAAPTPADLAARRRKTPAPTGPVAASLAPVETSRPARRPSPRPRRDDDAPPRPSAPSTADSSVNALDRARPAAPAVLSPEVLAMASRVAKQYRADNDGTPINANQLAVRLKVTSEEAAQALAVLDLGPDSPNTPIPSVNGRSARVTR